MQELVDKFRGCEYVINNDIYVLIDIVSEKYILRLNLLTLSFIFLFMILIFKNYIERGN